MVIGKKLSKNPELTQSRIIYSSYLRKKNPKHTVSKKALLLKPSMTGSRPQKVSVYIDTVVVSISSSAV